MDLSGRTALVTGAAGHIGAVVSESLAEMGASIGVLDRDAEACESRARILSAIRAGCAVPVPCNLTDEKETRAAVRQAVSRLGGLDIFIHSAAFVGATRRSGWAVPLEQQTVAAWDEALRVNLTAAFVIVQEARELLARSSHGSIILISSIYGLCGPDARLYEGTDMVNPVGYGVSKGGLLQLMRYLATGLAPHVRVNAISPGGVWRNQPETFRSRYASRTPLGRMATEEDLKGAIAYLASDLSAYVTGHNLVVDGGWTTW